MVGFLYLGGNVNVATPSGYECHPKVLSRCDEVTKENGTKLMTTMNAREACTGADVVATDTWVSMGEEDIYDQKIAEFAGYQVNKDLMSVTNPGSKFMHCLPRHQEEVADEVFYDEGVSLVWDEAENRMWTVMAVCMAMQGKTSM
ncbi:hypothetical protein TL16_g08384 [Triparma laevis f. inornata]|nr:hypothetical protein TL16_g08384 [Triparma laevis f. inornata]